MATGPACAQPFAFVVGRRHNKATNKQQVVRDAMPPTPATPGGRKWMDQLRNSAGSRVTRSVRATPNAVAARFDKPRGMALLRRYYQNAQRNTREHAESKLPLLIAEHEQASPRDVRLAQLTDAIFSSGVRDRGCATNAAYLPTGNPAVPEVVFAGRGNCGLPRLLAALCKSDNVKGAMTRQQRRGAVNYFEVGKTFMVAATPEFGGRFVPWSAAVQHMLLLRNFVQVRPNVKMLYYVLRAGRDGISFNDIDMLRFLTAEVPRFTIVLAGVDGRDPATAIDELKRHGIEHPVMGVGMSTLGGMDNLRFDIVSNVLHTLPTQRLVMHEAHRLGERLLYAHELRQLRPDLRWLPEDGFDGALEEEHDVPARLLGPSGTWDLAEDANDDSPPPAARDLGDERKPQRRHGRHGSGDGDDAATVEGPTDGAEADDDAALERATAEHDAWLSDLESADVVDVRMSVAVPSASPNTAPPQDPADATQADADAELIARALAAAADQSVQDRLRTANALTPVAGTEGDDDDSAVVVSQPPSAASLRTSLEELRTSLNLTRKELPKPLRTANALQYAAATSPWRNPLLWPSNVVPAAHNLRKNLVYHPDAPNNPYVFTARFASNREDMIFKAPGGRPRGVGKGGYVPEPDTPRRLSIPYAILGVADVPVRPLPFAFLRTGYKGFWTLPELRREAVQLQTEAVAATINPLLAEPAPDQPLLAAEVKKLELAERLRALPPVPDGPTLPPPPPVAQRGLPF